MKRGSLIALMLTLHLVSPWSASAHDVPDNVSIRAFIKPAGGRLQALVRVPIKALIDVEFPYLPGTDYVNLAQSESSASMASKLWVADFLTLYEGDRRLPRATVAAFVLSRETDPSFNSYAGALAHVNGPSLAANSFVELDRAVLDVLLETPIDSDQSDFSIVPRWGRLGIRVITTLGFLPPDGGIRSFEYEGDPPPYKLNPKPGQAAWHFVQLGVAHIVNQTDHLLFLFCLILPFRRFRALVPVSGPVHARALVRVMSFRPGDGASGDMDTATRQHAHGDSHYLYGYRRVFSPPPLLRADAALRQF